jgi:hypothetical protein
MYHCVSIPLENRRTTFITLLEPTGFHSITLNEKPWVQAMHLSRSICVYIACSQLHCIHEEMTTVITGKYIKGKYTGIQAQMYTCI